MKVTLCEKACKTCGFPKDGTKDTLYADIFDLMSDGAVFPCHEYLESKTGSENTGTETLDEVKVCRGYITFLKKEFPMLGHGNMKHLFDQIGQFEMDNCRTKQELFHTQKNIRNNIRLNNKIGD